MTASPAAAPSSVPALAVRGLTSAVGGRSVLEDVTFTVAPGEIFVIMGASGSGKTTLLRHLLGLSAPLAGEVELLGEPLWPASRERLYRLRRKIGSDVIATRRGQGYFLRVDG